MLVFLGAIFLLCCLPIFGDATFENGEIIFDNSEGEIEIPINISDGIDWSVHVVHVSGSGWLGTTNGGSGSGVIEIWIGANPLINDRQCYIEIREGPSFRDDGRLLRTITVRQEAGIISSALSLKRDEQVPVIEPFSDSFGSVVLHIFGNVNESYGPDWIVAVDDPTNMISNAKQDKRGVPNALTWSGGTSTVDVRFSENPTLEQRSVEIKLFAATDYVESETSNYAYELVESHVVQQNPGVVNAELFRTWSTSPPLMSNVNDRIFEVSSLGWHGTIVIRGSNSSIPLFYTVESLNGDVLESYKNGGEIQVEISQTDSFEERVAELIVWHGEEASPSEATEVDRFIFKQQGISLIPHLNLYNNSEKSFDLLGEFLELPSEPWWGQLEVIEGESPTNRDWFTKADVDWIIEAPNSDDGGIEIQSNDSTQVREANLEIWLGNPDDDSARFVKSVVLRQLGEVNDFADPIQFAELEFFPSGDSSWFVQEAETYGGVSAIQSGAISDSEKSTIEAQVEGPGKLVFYWKVDSESGYDFCRFSVNGSEVGSISGSKDWERFEHIVSEDGNHSLSWSYEKDGSEESGRDAAWLDLVSYGNFQVRPKFIKSHNSANIQRIDISGTGNWSARKLNDFAVLDTYSGIGDGSINISVPVNEGDWRYTEISVAGQMVLLDQEGEITTNEAVNDTSIQLFPVAGTTAWKTEPDGGMDGGSVIRSGIIPDNARSSMQATVSGPGDFGFHWRTESEGPDELIFKLDGEELKRISGNRDWEPFTVTLEEHRDYHVEWIYQKDESIAVGSDAGYVDMIVTQSEYMSWAINYFNLDQLSQQDISGPDADPDQDGVPNRIEQKLNLSPVDSTSTVVFKIANPTNGTLSLELAPMTSDVLFRIETANDLSNWTTYPMEQLLLENGAASLNLEDTSGDELFFRVVWGE